MSSLEWTENEDLFPNPLLGMTSLSTWDLEQFLCTPCIYCPYIYCPCGCVFIHRSIARVTSVTVKALLFCQDSRAVILEVLSAVI